MQPLLPTSSQDWSSSKDIRGDLHVHTSESDGKNTLRQMAEAARSLGYEYLAITDHSQHVTIANGFDARRLAKQIKAIDKLNSQIKGIRILKGIEVDILADGSLDLPDAILADLDFTRVRDPLQVRSEGGRADRPRGSGDGQSAFQHLRASDRAAAG